MRQDGRLRKAIDELAKRGMRLRGDRRSGQRDGGDGHCADPQGSRPAGVLCSMPSAFGMS